MKKKEIERLVDSLIESAGNSFRIDQSNLSIHEVLQDFIEGNKKISETRGCDVFGALAEGMDAYSLHDILEDYIMQLSRSILVLQREERQPSHHVEFDPITNIDLDVMKKLFSEEYVKDVGESHFSASYIQALNPEFHSSLEKDKFEDAYKSYSRMFQSFEKKLRTFDGRDGDAFAAIKLKSDSALKQHARLGSSKQRLLKEEDNTNFPGSSPAVPVQTKRVGGSRVPGGTTTLSTPFLQFDPTVMPLAALIGGGAPGAFGGGRWTPANDSGAVSKILKGHLQADDALRALLTEMTTIGLDPRAHEVEKSLAVIECDTTLCADSRVLAAESHELPVKDGGEEVGGGGLAGNDKAMIMMGQKRSFLFGSLVKEEEVETKKSGSRGASTSAIDCLAQLRDLLEAFDARACDTRRAASENMKRRFEAATALRFAVQALESKVHQGSFSSSSTSCSSVPGMTLEKKGDVPADSVVVESVDESVTSAEMKVEDVEMEVAVLDKQKEEGIAPSENKAVIAVREEEELVDISLAGKITPAATYPVVVGVASQGMLVSQSPLQLSMDDVPFAASRIVNPFGSGFGLEPEAWSWLVNPLCTNRSSGLTEVELELDCLSHPLVHRDSLFTGKVSLRDCLPLWATSSKEEVKGNKVLLNIAAEVDLAVTGDESVSLQRNYAEKILTSMIAKDVADREETTTAVVVKKEQTIPGDQQIPSVLSTGYSPPSAMTSTSTDAFTQYPTCLDFCVARAQWVLKLGFGAVVVDAIRTGDRYTDSTHRAVLTAQILSASFDGLKKVNGGECAESNKTTETTASVGFWGNNYGKRRSSGGGATTATVKKRAGYSENWGPLLVLVKAADVIAWEDGLRAVLGSKVIDPLSKVLDPLAGTLPSWCNLQGLSSRSLQVVGYYGSDEDRACIRTYLTSEDMYTSRAPIHVLITHYEAFLADYAQLKEVMWHTLVLDQPWGLVSNVHNGNFIADLASLSVRQRLLVCDSLARQTPLSHPPQEGHVKPEPGTQPDTNISSSSEHQTNSSPLVLPDVGACAALLFPPIQSLLTTAYEIESVAGSSEPHWRLDTQIERLLLRLLGSLTAVCDPTILPDTIDPAFPHKGQLMQSLPWLHWWGVSVETSKGYCSSGSLQMVEGVQPMSVKTEMIDENGRGELRHMYNLAIVNYSSVFIDDELQKELFAATESRRCARSAVACTTKRVEKSNSAKVTTTAAPTAVTDEVTTTSNRGGSQSRNSSSTARPSGSTNKSAAASSRKRVAGDDSVPASSPTTTASGTTDEPKKKRKYVWKNRPAHYAPVKTTAVAVAAPPSGQSTDEQSPSPKPPPPPASTKHPRNSRASDDVLTAKAKAAAAAAAAKARAEAAAACETSSENDDDVDVANASKSRRRPVKSSTTNRPVVEDMKSARVILDKTDEISGLPAGDTLTSQETTHSHRKSSHPSLSHAVPTNDEDDGEVEDTATSGTVPQPRRHAGLKPGTIPRARPGPKPKLRFSSGGPNGRLQVTRSGLEKGEVYIGQNDEKNKFVTKRGAAWQAFIDTPGRLRFLGFHPSEKIACMAFDYAYRQRARCGSVNGWTEGSKLALGARTHVEVAARLDHLNRSGLLQYDSSDDEDSSEPGGKIPAHLEDTSLVESLDNLTKVAAADREREREIELRDVGSVVPLLDRHSLIDGIRDMLAPRIAAEQPLNSWGVTCSDRGVGPVALTSSQLTSISSTPMAPAGYALLVGQQGLSSAVRLSSFRCVLGKALSCTRALADRLLGHGSKAPEFHGMPLSLDPLTGEELVHIGNDASISRRHAEIHWCGATATYLIRNISKSGSLYVQGRPLAHGAPSVPLESKSVVQVGSFIFLFVLPVVGKIDEELDPPLVQRAYMTFALMEQIRQRTLYSFTADFSVSAPELPYTRGLVPPYAPALGLLSPEVLACASQAGLHFSHEPGHIAGGDASSELSLPPGLLAIEERALTGNYRRTASSTLSWENAATNSAAAALSCASSGGVSSASASTVFYEKSSIDAAFAAAAAAAKAAAAEVRASVAAGASWSERVESMRYSDADEEGVMNDDSYKMNGKKRIRSAGTNSMGDDEEMGNVDVHYSDDIDNSRNEGTVKKKRRCWTRAMAYARNLGIPEADPEMKDETLAELLVPGARGQSVKKRKILLMNWLRDKEQDMIREGVLVSDPNRALVKFTGPKPKDLIMQSPQARRAQEIGAEKPPRSVGKKKKKSEAVNAVNALLQTVPVQLTSGRVNDMNSVDLRVRNIGRGLTAYAAKDGSIGQLGKTMMTLVNDDNEDFDDDNEDEDDGNFEKDKGEDDDNDGGDYYEKVKDDGKGGVVVDNNGEDDDQEEREKEEEEEEDMSYADGIDDGSSSFYDDGQVEEVSINDNSNEGDISYQVMGTVTKNTAFPVVSVDTSDCLIRQGATASNNHYSHRTAEPM